MSVKCSMCSPPKYSKLSLGISSHDVIEIEDPNLNGIMDLSIGFWNNDKCRDSFMLCRKCKVKVLRKAANIIEKGIEG